MTRAEGSRGKKRGNLSQNENPKVGQVLSSATSTRRKSFANQRLTENKCQKTTSSKKKNLSARIGPAMGRHLRSADVACIGPTLAGRHPASAAHQRTTSSKTICPKDTRPEGQDSRPTDPRQRGPADSRQYRKR